jgi:hypothetical protein
MERHRHEQNEEAQVQRPLERVVRAEVVQECDVAARTEHDRGHLSLPRAADV